MPNLEESYWERQEVLLEACERLQREVFESLGAESPCTCSFRIIDLTDMAGLTEASNAKGFDVWRDSTGLILGIVTAPTRKDLEEARADTSKLFTCHENREAGSVEICVVPPWAKPAAWDESKFPTYLSLKYVVKPQTVEHVDAETISLFQPLTLALSGGGVRAAVYQLGILVFLAQHNRLKHVREIVSVSGGSILAAHFLKHWPDAIKGLGGFRGVAADLLKICRSNIRDNVAIPWIWSRFTPWAWFRRSRGLTGRLQAEYEKVFEGTTLGDLTEGRPNIAIVATEGVRQERVAFTQSQILRWQIHQDDGHSTPAPIVSKGVELSLAVAASSCFPPVFPRLHLTYKDFGVTYKEFKDELQLNDGGVVSNLGIEVLVALRELGWAKHSLILIADAERDLAVKPGNSPFTDSNATFAALGKAARESAAREFGENGISIPFADRVTGNGSLAFRTETALFNYRTDLDCPTWQEIHALMIHGAMVARQATRERFDPIDAQTLKQTIATIIAEAEGPANLAVPIEADLRDCGSRPLGKVKCHVTVAIILILALLIGGGYGVVRLVRSVLANRAVPIESAYFQDLRGYGNLYDLLDHSLTHVVEATETDYNQIMLLHRAEYSYELIVVAVEKPDRKPGYRIASFESLVGTPIRPDMKVRTINASDVSKVKDYFPAVEETKAELVVPIEANGRVVGIINSEAEAVGHFTKARQAKVEDLALSLGRLLQDIKYEPGIAEDELPYIRRLAKTTAAKITSEPPSTGNSNGNAPADGSDEVEARKNREQEQSQLRERIAEAVNNQRFANEESSRREKRNAVGIVNVSGSEREVSGVTKQAQIVISDQQGTLLAEVVLPFTANYDAKNFTGILAEYRKDPIACSGTARFKVLRVGDKLEFRDVTFEDLVPSGGHSASRLTTGGIRDQVLARLMK